MLSDSHKGFNIKPHNERAVLLKCGGECVMVDAMEFTTERINKIRDAAMQFKDSVQTFFKEHDVEVKDWKFGVESSDGTQMVDVAVKIAVKPKKK